MEARGRAHEDLEQVARQLVDPVGVLDHDDHGLRRRACPQRVGQQRLERRLAELGVEAAREVVVGERDAEDGLEQRHPGDERGVDGGQLRLQPRAVGGLGVVVLEAQQAAPDLTPGEVGGVAAVGLALPERDEHAPAARGADELRDQAGLAHAGLGGDPQHAAPLRERVGQPGVEPGELRAAPHEAQLVAGLAPRHALQRAVERPRLHGCGLALDAEVRQSLPDERVTGRLADRRGGVDPAVGRGRHEPCRKVHRIAQADEGPPQLVAVGAAAQPAVRQADLDLARRGRALEVSQGQRGGRGPGRVVLVREWRAEDPVQVGALVAQRELEQVPAVGCEDPL